MCYEFRKIIFNKTELTVKLTKSGNIWLMMKIIFSSPMKCSWGWFLNVL
jgi:hypothetical protein